MFVKIITPYGTNPTKMLFLHKADLLIIYQHNEKDISDK